MADTPEETPTPRPSLSPPLTPSPSATLTPVPEVIELPEDCGSLFDEDFIAEMESTGLPLNDPGITMTSTELTAGLTLLENEASLRCTWGVPSEVGLATTIALVTEAQADSIIAEAEMEDFECSTVSWSETRCTFVFRDDDADFGAVAHGEEHVLRGNAWIATRWLEVEIPGYTDDIVAKIWG